MLPFDFAQDRPFYKVGDGKGGGRWIPIFIGMVITKLQILRQPSTKPEVVVQDEQIEQGIDRDYHVVPITSGLLVMTLKKPFDYTRGKHSP